MELLGINIIGWAAILVTLTTTVIAAIMFILGSNRLHYLWGVFCIFVAIWSAAFFMVIQAPTPEAARFWWKIAYIGIIINPAVFYNFTLEFAKRMHWPSVIAAYTIGWIFVLLTITTNLIVDEMRFVFGFFYDSPVGALHPYMTAFFVILVLAAHIILFRAYRASNNKTFKQRTEYFFLATSIGFIGAGLNFFPAYGVDISPVTILTVIFAWPMIAYAIMKYGLFSVRIVTAQLLTLVLTVFALIHIVISQSMQEVILNGLLLALTFVVGVYLIRSVQKEVEQREEIERLATNLESANKRLKEMDQLKSQFLSIASHDLRAPLTAIRNFMSILLEGTYGKLPPAAEEGTQQVYERATEMADMVDNYLNVSRIEQGRMKYDFADIDFAHLLNETVKPFIPVAKEKGLKFVYTPVTGPWTIKADESKMREVIENLVSNSINYTPQGSITVTAEKLKDKVRFTIQDTGIGMTEATKANLFKLFNPGEDSRTYNPKSTGVGLYITRAHVEAHKGTITAESAGKGQGSRFMVEVSIVV